MVWPQDQPRTNRAYQTASIARRNAGEFIGLCPLVYRETTAERCMATRSWRSRLNLVSRIILRDGGTTLRLAARQAEFLTSTDERFRPVYLSNAPDGTLYIVDMYRGVIQQRADITEYLRDHIITHKLERPTGLGRIYRVVHETTKRDTEKGPATRTSAQLVARLSHPNGWWRDSAQQWLVERSDKSVVPALVKLAADAEDWRTRVHALWTLDGLDSIDPPTVTKALDDPSRDVRVTAIRTPSAGSGTPPTRSRRRCCAMWTIRIGPCGSRSRRRSALCRRGRGNAPSCPCSIVMRTIRSWSTRR